MQKYTQTVHLKSAQSIKERLVLHIDFNSYFATIEQQANPRLRGKPIGITGGDRSTRTVLSTASVEAKKMGVKTGMNLYDALKICPEITLVTGDSDKYLDCTKRFLNILKNYSPYLEVFSIDEAFLELSPSLTPEEAIAIAVDIKNQVRKKIGEWVTCSIGVSYNKLMAKLVSGLYKPDGLIIIEDTQAAQFVLDRVPLDELCGIGPRIKTRLNNMGIWDFQSLRKLSAESLQASFKTYGLVLYQASRGLDSSPIQTFYEKEIVKSVGHQHTTSHNTKDLLEIRQMLLKLAELVARRLRAKKMVGKTINFWYRSANFESDGAQISLGRYTDDGLEFFKAAYAIFLNIWDRELLRLLAISVNNLKSKNPHTLTFLQEDLIQEKITEALDKINDKFGEFTLKRAVLFDKEKIYRKPNPYLSDRRFVLTE